MLINRDPFARSELHRASHDAPADGCRYCGNVRTTRTGRRRLYGYWYESDAGRRSHVLGLFCSVGCMRTYHGG